ncbi:MAG: hypothetical protein KGH64_03420 [Candidatus Micrarchaeota archaeon]|nr:hypothetical protein [Candidatus Micrarchaeota archaeon]
MHQGATVHHHRTEHQPKQQYPLTVILAAFIIVLVVVTYLAYSFGYQAGINNGISKQQSAGPGYLNSVSTQPYQSTVPTNTTYVNPTLINVSSYGGFILPSQANSLIGMSGYSAYESNSPAQLHVTLSGLIPNGLGYNITSEYIVAYSTNATVNVMGYQDAASRLQEFMLISTNPKAVYGEGINLYNATFNLTKLKQDKNLTNVSVGSNLSASGMVYSYSSASTNLPGNIISYGARLIGYKGNTTVFTQLSMLNTSKVVNITALASVIASHIK